MNSFLTWMQERLAGIDAHEAAAQAALQASDEKAYRAVLLEKAELLAALEDDAEALLPKLPPAEQIFARQKLHGFASGAQFSLQLNSPWFMSALLYPEDHKLGDPHDLQVFVTELEARLS